MILLVVLPSSCFALNYTTTQVGYGNKPFAYNQGVVWASAYDGTFTWNAQSSQITRVADAAFYAVADGNHVVIARPEGLVSNIYGRFYGSYEGGYMDMSRDDVVWGRNLWNHTSGFSILPGYNGEAPHIDNGQVSFEEDIWNGDILHRNITLAPAGYGQGEIPTYRLRLDSAGGFYSATPRNVIQNARFDSGRVVWGEQIYALNWESPDYKGYEIYLWSPEDGVQLLAGGRGDQRNPTICGNVITWQDYSNTDSHGEPAIMIAQLQSVPEPSSLLALGTLVAPLLFLKRRR